MPSSPYLIRTEIIECRVLLGLDPSHEADLADLYIEVEFAPVDVDEPIHHDEAAVIIRRWLADYVANRDLSWTYDFAPIGRNLSLYWLKALAAVRSEVCAVTVTIDGDVRYRAELS